MYIILSHWEVKFIAFINEEMKIIISYLFSKTMFQLFRKFRNFPVEKLLAF